LFHPVKCTVLTVTIKRNPIVTEYTIRGQLLAAVTSAKYQGVTITDKVNWSQHIDSITNKANRTLGFLCRNLKISSISIKEQAYKTLVRPLVGMPAPYGILIIRQTSGSWSVYNEGQQGSS
jgi:hypothetical protein